MLLDFLMPELDGFEFTRFVRQDPRFKETPIIAVSALKSENDKIQMKRLGVTDFLPKPFTVEDLARIVEQYHRLKDAKAHKAA